MINYENKVFHMQIQNIKVHSGDDDTIVLNFNDYEDDVYIFFEILDGPLAGFQLKVSLDDTTKKLYFDRIKGE